MANPKNILRRNVLVLTFRRNILILALIIVFLLGVPVLAHDSILVLDNGENRDQVQTLSLSEDKDLSNETECLRVNPEEEQNDTYQADVTGYIVHQPTNQYVTPQLELQEQIPGTETWNCCLNVDTGLLDKILDFRLLERLFGLGEREPGRYCS